MRTLSLCLPVIILFISSPACGQHIHKLLGGYYQALHEDDEMNGNVAASNDAQSQFELASVSKLFTAIAVRQLAEKGRVNLDSSFRYYFPEYDPS